MKELYTWDRFRSIGLLVASALIVSFIWKLYVLPMAEQAKLDEIEAVRLRPTVAVPPNFFTIIKDGEQQTAVILMSWACALAVFRLIELRRQRKVLEQNILRMSSSLRILADDAHTFEASLESLPNQQQGYVVVKAARRALQRFGSTGRIQDASTAVHNTCESEATRFDSELGPLRFGIWAIPALGFIGTVRGIGLALKSANLAMMGEPTAVTEGLGVSFNSTLTALTLSIVLMYIINELQQIQERLVLDTESYLDDELVTKLEERLLR